jgi:hypothetical protein
VSFTKRAAAHPRPHDTREDWSSPIAFGALIESSAELFSLLSPPLELLSTHELLFGLSQSCHLALALWKETEIGMSVELTPLLVADSARNLILSSLGILILWSAFRPITRWRTDRLKLEKLGFLAPRVPYRLPLGKYSTS